MISSFFDPPKATAAANALLGEDINFLFAVMDEPSYLQVANDAGVWAGAWNTDVRQFGPEVYVNTLQLDFGSLLPRAGERRARRHVDGEDPARPAAARSRRLGRQRASRRQRRGRPAPTTAARRHAQPLHRADRRQPGHGAARRRVRPSTTSRPTSSTGPSRVCPASTADPGDEGDGARRRRSGRPGPATSRRASTGCGRCATSTSSCAAAKSTRCSARTAPGKTTLCNILAGIYRADSGHIEVEGTAGQFHSPAQAIAAGIGMVHQHFRLVAPMTVAENIHLGWDATPTVRHPPRPGGTYRPPDGPVRAAGRSGGEGLAALRRRATAGGDPADAGPGDADTDPRRAHRGAHHRRGRRAVRA